MAATKLRNQAAAKQRTAHSKYRDDPLAYAQQVLRVDWWGKQVAIAHSVRDNQRTLVRAGHGVGKTFLSGGLVNWYFDVYEDSVIPTTAPTARQVRDLLWKEIRAQRKTEPPAGVVQLRDQNNPDHYAIGFSTKPVIATDEFGSQAAQGFHAPHLLYVLDEGPGVPAPVWDAVEGVIVGADNRVLAIGNPTVTSGPFYEAERSGKWHVIEISVLEHPNILAALVGEPEPYPGAVSLAWLEDKLDDPFWCESFGEPGDDAELAHWRNEGAFEFPPQSNQWYMPRSIAEAKILGKYPRKSTDTVWSAAWIDAAIERLLIWAKGEPLEFGLDVARYGDDSTALHARRGPCSLHHESWRKMGTMATAGRAANIVMDARQNWFAPDDLPPHIIVRVDSGGGDVGAGVVDRLREILGEYSDINIIEVSAAGRSIEPDRYPNRRSELWFAGASWGERGRLDLTRLEEGQRDILAAQLTAPKYKYDSSGRRVVESKDELKRRAGRSPDDADAFNLAYYGEGSGILTSAVDQGLKKESVWTSAPEQSRWQGNWNVGSGGGRKWRD